MECLSHRKHSHLLWTTSVLWRYVHDFTTQRYNTTISTTIKNILDSESCFQPGKRTTLLTSMSKRRRVLLKCFPAWIMIQIFQTHFISENIFFPWLMFIKIVDHFPSSQWKPENVNLWIEAFTVLLFLSWKPTPIPFSLESEKSSSVSWFFIVFQFWKKYLLWIRLARHSKVE